MPAGNKKNVQDLVIQRLPTIREKKQKYFTRSFHTEPPENSRNLFLQDLIIRARLTIREKKNKKKYYHTAPADDLNQKKCTRSYHTSPAEKLNPKKTMVQGLIMQLLLTIRKKKKYKQYLSYSACCQFKTRETGEERERESFRDSNILIHSLYRVCFL